MEAKRKVYWFSLLIFSALLGDWVYRIWGLISFEIVKEEENYLGSLAIYLLSWLIVFLIVNFFAWLNFKFLFLNWRNSLLDNHLFWSTQLGALALIFELLQWLSKYDSDMMKDNLILTMIIALYFLAFTWFFDMLNTKRNQAKLIQEKERAELSLLQSQLNPHFLFNALNTTYSTAVEEESPFAAKQILQISDLMRFSLEKAGLEAISLEEELGFLEKYINLQKDRFSNHNKDQIQVEINWDGIESRISPMLIQPLIENAFKFTPFGLGSESAFLKINLSVEEKVLTLNVDNSYIKPHVDQNKGTGKGLKSLKQRLRTFYRNKHKLLIEEKAERYSVYLEINLKR